MTLRIHQPLPLSALTGLMLLVGCDSGPGDDADSIERNPAPETYEFASRFEEGSSVSYSGQVFRHVLISDMKRHIGTMTGRLDSGWFPTPGEVEDELNFFFDFDGETSGQIAHGASTDPGCLQTTYDDISSGKTLSGKVAGNDLVGQHKDWSTEFVGWGEEGSTTPGALVRGWFTEIDEQAVAWSEGTTPLDPAGNAVTGVYLTETGLDLSQLIQKFLLGAIALSQGADDYLDDDTEGKGLLSDNTVPEEGKPYTALEHAWDEGFGYFGAARDFGDYTDDEIAAKDGRADYSSGYHDSNNDGSIDLLSERNVGHAINAAKRDRGANEETPTDLTQGAWDAFLVGRALISSADGALTAEQMSELQTQRDVVLANWEAAIAATVVHYINDVLADMGTFGTENYNFASHAKHWSECKGFALTLQFNPRSPLSDDQFAQLHELLSDSPALPGSEGADGYKTALLQARDLLQQAYGFADANMGDEHGEGGW